MIVDTINNPETKQPQAKAVEMVDTERVTRNSSFTEPDTSSEVPKVQPEEMLDRINELTQDGLYSVRFERDDSISELVVKIFDNDTQEVIRQIPAEELLSFKATFEELVGTMVNTIG